MTISKIYSGIRGILLIAVCLAVIKSSYSEHRVCGRGLRDTMDMVCPNGFQTHKTKRTSLSLDEDLSNENTEEGFNFGLSLDMLPFLTSMENSGIAKIRRRRHGIVHECCDKPCKLSEMQAYCKP